MEFEYVSDRYCAIYQMDCEDVMANPKLVFDTVHPEELDDHMALNHKAFRDKKTFLWEGRFIIGGDLRWLHIESTPEPFENGDTRWFGIVQDITDRKQAEDALQKSHETLLAFLNSIDATIYVVDMQSYEILFMNKYMINSFGRDMTGEVCCEVFRGKSGPCSHCPNEQLVDGNGNPTGVYTWQDQNPITGKWYINYDRAIEWKDGRLVKIQIATDITEMKYMEEQLRQAHKMESLGTLAGGIAHEFNNMLGVILGNTELAFDDIPDWNPAKDCLNEIKTASLRAKEVIEKLLSVARKTPKSRKPIPIGPVIEESLDLLSRTIPTTIDIRKRIACSTEMILGDTTEINQVIINLCNNSFHAMAEGIGTLEVNLNTIQLNPESALRYTNLEPGDYVSLTVKDTGEGIEPAFMDRLFDPYFTTKDVDQGLGMGLAVVHSIVKKHDGDIKIESEVGKGTTVEILLPVIEEQTEIITEAFETPQMGAERILLVDDESSIIKMVTLMLNRSGYDVIGKTSSSNALKAFKENPEQFDLVISDMTMPEMAGDQFVQEIKQICPDIPVILCTGHSNRMDENKAKEVGIDAFMMKPFSKKDLTRTIPEVLKRSQTGSIEKKPKNDYF
jgi:PAS domain S-box-containing protein